MSFLTGSYAYGTPTEKSDIDVVVLLTNVDRTEAGHAGRGRGDDLGGVAGR